MPNRHGTPSGPWPFIDLNDPIDPEQLSTAVAPRRQTHGSETEYPFNNEADNWRLYPQSLFPNWTRGQQKKSGIRDIIHPRRGNQGRHVRPMLGLSACIIYRLNILKEGRFHAKTSREPGWVVRGDTDSINCFWEALTKPVGASGHPDSNILRRHLERTSVTDARNTVHYRSLLLLLFSRMNTLLVSGTVSSRTERSYPASTSTIPDTSYDFSIPSDFFSKEAVIDTDEPLLLQSSNILLDHDLIGIHAVRRSVDHPSPSTVITYLPPPLQHRITTADSLHARIMATGRSVYWTKLYRISADATLLVLAQLWYALYAWDEALEALTTEVVWLEAHTLSTLHIYEAPKPSPSLQLATTTDPTSAPRDPNELHVLRAHLLHYEELLADFRKTVVFLVDTPHPGIPADLPSQIVVKKECNTLLMDIKRLEGTRAMLDERVRNAMGLAFSSVTIEDSKRMQRLSEAALRDSAAMKQIAYITMLYLPASFCAMHVSIPIYFAVALPLTTLTIWVMMLLYLNEKRKREINEIGEGPVVPPVRPAVTRLLYPIRVFTRAFSFTPRKKRPIAETVMMSARFSVRTTSHRATVVRSARSSLRSSRRAPLDIESLDSDESHEVT
ncbi:uncharacterized protein BT62DRAFT_923955 [Guyanagaster necrorhizus]|uniref:Uncharacterized protein n=1 Tax=Guyanagaster necrorhizus TaxID=856835 RepID=A0A9P8AN48_9AGAR|nr:uncharacterized protein BT62DRAFT_923955 [Guyanagaster necrorhizus MCA 3950]KAG7440527.1 hypothetical protein BT62DRAFT_923955 [Guyanagaster necrorhizus MCA 3950]